MLRARDRRQSPAVSTSIPARYLTYTAAIVQKRWLPKAQDLLARNEPAKGPRGARRILQRHLIDVIYRAMTADCETWQHDITRHPLTA
jgi:hypothetical protein